jgi:hypothetical protein
MDVEERRNRTGGAMTGIDGKFWNYNLLFLRQTLVCDAETQTFGLLNAVLPFQKFIEGEGITRGSHSDAPRAHFVMHRYNDFRI